MKRRMIVYICTLILVCMFFKTIPTVAKENTDAINPPTKTKRKIS